MADFKVSFSDNRPEMQVQFNSDTGANLAFGEVHVVSVGGEVYKGKSAVTPKVTQQVLPTKGKTLVKDVTVREIPYFDVSNPSGGKTIYIANEV